MAADYAKSKAPLHHIGLTVANIERSLEFYCKLGFEPRNPEVTEVSGPWIEAVTGYDDARLRITVISLGGLNLELLEYVTPTGKKSAGIETRDAGSAHVAIRADDINAEYERLKKEGLEFKSAPQTIPPGNKSLSGAIVAYLLDPDGNTAELVQTP